MDISLVLLFLNYIVIVNCQDSLSFPISLSASSPSNINNKKREPLYAPSACPENHLLYPGNRELDDWICDCAPGYIYYPKKDGCYAIYRRGPCEQDEYLVLHKGQVIPTCEKNRCQTDGIVLYKNVCHQLDTPGGPCQREEESDPVKILTVVRSTLQLECVTSTSPLSLIVAPHSCPPGSRRSNNNDCRPSVTDI